MARHGRTLLLTLVPLGLGALVTIAWQNSHQLAVQARELAALRADFAPGQTLMLRFDRNEEEMRHLRELVEQELVQCGQRSK